MLIRVGENAVVLQVSYERTVDCVARIQALYRILKDRNPSEILTLRPGLDSLAVECRDGFDPSGLLLSLEADLETPHSPEPPSEIISVPVCYEEPLARDLVKVAQACELTPNEVIDLHTSAAYDVWILGFMPGFPYLGTLPEELQLPRKSKPDPHIPAGSVAIAEEYSGVYPFDSPGGWHILGSTPISLIDYKQPSPWTFDYGMRIRFVPITLEQYTQRLNINRKSRKDENEATCH